MTGLAAGIDIECREVGLRDGLQIVDTIVSTEQKIRWLEAELTAGLPEVEVTSFVPPKLAPQFGDSVKIVEAGLKLKPEAISCLAPNFKGAQRAFDLAVSKVNYVTSVSESHNQANVRRTVAESVTDFEAIVAARNEQGLADTVRLGVTLSTSFGCSIEGNIDPTATLNLVERFATLGADEIAVADTVGYANPRAVKSLTRELVKSFDQTVDLACHFHDTRGLGLANVYSAIESGIVRFDASIAGLGGCPHAPLATGNIVTEDLVFMCESAGLNTGIDLGALVKVREIVAAALPDEPLHGFYAKAGPPKGLTRSS